jgi:hypothetical protein
MNKVKKHYLSPLVSNIYPLFQLHATNKGMTIVQQQFFRRPYQLDTITVLGNVSRAHATSVLM